MNQKNRKQEKVKQKLV